MDGRRRLARRYYSARLKTQNSFSQYQGTFEARIKLNPALGCGPPGGW